MFMPPRETALPRAGPQTIAIEYPASATPLQAGENKSPRTPPVLVMGAEAQKPPQNRVNIIVCTSFAVAVAKVKQIATNMGVRTGTLRPYTSLNGAQSKGPIPKPMRYKVVPSVATCVDM